MKISEIEQIIIEYIPKPIEIISIPKQIFEEGNGRMKFNNKIRDEVERRPGVYVWIDNETEEIIYIGMAGTIKTDGCLREHSIQQRLLASRGKDKYTGKDIQTNDYVYSLMQERGMEIMKIVLIYTKDGEAPAFLEALLLNEFYKRKKYLPILNKSF
jgi:hypothetical protein